MFCLHNNRSLLIHFRGNSLTQMPARFTDYTSKLTQKQSAASAFDWFEGRAQSHLVPWEKKDQDLETIGLAFFFRWFTQNEVITNRRLHTSEIEQINWSNPKVNLSRSSGGVLLIICFSWGTAFSIGIRWVFLFLSAICIACHYAA